MIVRLGTADTVSSRGASVLPCDTNELFSPTQERLWRFRSDLFLGHSCRAAAASLQPSPPLGELQAHRGYQLSGFGE
jgi:hypothetical protein